MAWCCVYVTAEAGKSRRQELMGGWIQTWANDLTGSARSEFCFWCKNQDSFHHWFFIKPSVKRRYLVLQHVDSIRRATATTSPWISASLSSWWSSCVCVCVHVRLSLWGPNGGWDLVRTLGPRFRTGLLRCVHVHHITNYSRGVHRKSM